MAPDAYEEFTDRQRTRVVRRESDDQAATEASIGNTQSFSKHKERLFDDLSIAQIIAGAAAAATSVVLASRIGIAGSVIGAAVSSVVTVVSSQLYRRFLTASAEKLKKNVVAPAIGDDRHSARGKRSGSPYHAGGQDVTQPIAPDPIDISSGQATTWTSYGSASGYAREAGGTPGAYASQGAQNGAAASAGSGTRIAPKRLQARAVAERSATQRKVVAFSIISAVVALVACAAVILVLTAGEGLGTRTTPIFAPATEELDASADTTVDTSENGTSSDEESQAATGSESNPGAASDGTSTDSPSTPSTSDPATGGSGDGTQGSGSDTTPGDGADSSGSGDGASGGTGGSQSGTSGGTGGGTSSGATGQTPTAGTMTGAAASR